MFLYMSAFMITSVVEEAFFVDKACRVNLGFPKNVCDNIAAEENKMYKQQVQVEVSTFHQYENIASQAVPVVLAFFLGAWSDRVGRKIPLLLGLAGNFIYSFMIVVNALQDSWPLETVLWSACLPCALTGGNLTVFMAAFSYLADTTSEQQRTMRTTLLEVAYLLPMPIGVALGSYLFGVLDRSFAAMFTINAALLLASMAYTAVFVKLKTSGDHARWGGGGCRLRSLFEVGHVVESVKSLLRPRSDNRRMYLLLTLTAMSLYTFQRDEKHMMYLYAQLKFHWDVPTYSKFRTYQSSLYVVGLVVGVPVVLRVLRMRDTTTAMLGAASHTVARFIFAFGRQPWLLYLGGGFGLLGPVVAPVLRSVTSKLVPSSERGKVFALFTVADTTVPLVSGIIYTQVYNHTITSLPQAFFFVTAASQILVFIIAL
ncbi:hypothetical protein AAG570_004965 [Ranatra chinensis]|uniref:Proton-coupled folate transporter n=1 Tax=Ranatra chinensis TaxID=642074 RepID=A0ABD0YBU0_9HEMI